MVQLNLQAFAQDPGVALMLRVQAGDQDAFAELIKKYSGLIARIVVDLTGTNRDLPDITQDVFLRVFRARDRYLPTARFSSWLSKITTRIVFNRSRESRCNPTLNAELEKPGQNHLGSSTGPGPQPTEIVSLDEELRSVSVAIGTLPTRQRRAIQLFYFEGLGYAAIAENMETSRTAVKAILCRARHRLRQHLESGARPKKDHSFTAEDYRCTEQFTKQSIVLRETTQIECRFDLGT